MCSTSSQHVAAVTCDRRHHDVTKMAASVSRFASVSRKVGSYVLNSLVFAQAAACGVTMDSERPTKVWPLT